MSSSAFIPQHFPASAGNAGDLTQLYNGTAEAAIPSAPPFNLNVMQNPQASMMPFIAPFAQMQMSQMPAFPSLNMMFSGLNSFQNGLTRDLSKAEEDRLIQTLVAASVNNQNLQPALYNLHGVNNLTYEDWRDHYLKHKFRLKNAISARLWQLGKPSPRVTHSKTVKQKKPQLYKRSEENTRRGHPPSPRAHNSPRQKRRKLSRASLELSDPGDFSSSDNSHTISGSDHSLLPSREEFGTAKRSSEHPPSPRTYNPPRQKRRKSSQASLELSDPEEFSSCDTSHTISGSDDSFVPSWEELGTAKQSSKDGNIRKFGDIDINVEKAVDKANMSQKGAFTEADMRLFAQHVAENPGATQSFISSTFHERYPSRSNWNAWRRMFWTHREDLRILVEKYKARSDDLDYCADEESHPTTCKKEEPIVISSSPTPPHNPNEDDDGIVIIGYKRGPRSHSPVLVEDLANKF